MSLKESIEGLLGSKESNCGPKHSYSEHERMPLDVRFRIWYTDKYDNIPQQPIRFSFNMNASVEETGSYAFQKCFGKVPEEMGISITKGFGSLSDIRDTNEKLRNLFQEGETLVLSDVSDYNKMDKELANCYLKYMLSGLVGLVALIIIITEVVPWFTSKSDN
ncbi:hypothetical protein EJF18_30463 [Clavispora lusitaniae]|uniref:Uncharacterized protein n=1 Tax=Clavispora lusitaniae TaxID=36911 RepID=A0ACD0WJ43_CLALS|nr:hypothetical protein EJF14_30463 [Clavispora lusitaniae]QFZ33200.1 hypothetical protein EJF16_30463 [Clavispora lusitaniae]QFZ38871.1 hypothetical protein EJF15_30463 [Clavispora lusitaniae]QFZ44553.1 hypothetical protein EJF18_30463 [Clavispora lusitaniae]QFZ50230.1 hypothetical protein EJF17_30463 [Clavispora lusitaniae]